MGKRHQNRLLRITDPKFAFQTPNDVFRFRTLAGSKESGYDRRLFLLSLEVMTIRLRITIVKKRLTECPELREISLRFLKTKSSVNDLGLNKTFWLFFEFW
jgi:hypothetical protein